jgi:hypothetical protein
MQPAAATDVFVARRVSLIRVIDLLLAVEPSTTWGLDFAHSRAKKQFLNCDSYEKNCDFQGSYLSRASSPCSSPCSSAPPAHGGLWLTAKPAPNFAQPANLAQLSAVASHCPPVSVCSSRQLE